MDYTIIEVPDKNDSVSRIVLKSTVYKIRFTYNDTYDYWRFGVYDSQSNPIVLGMKIVPNIPINIFHTSYDLPFGIFAALTKLDRIGRDDLIGDKVQFIFCPLEREESE